MAGPDSIPEHVRRAIRRQLDLLVEGRLPQLLTWVHHYGETRTTLVPQPEEVWTHPEASYVVRPDGSAWGVLPVWTADESPSDLSVEFEVTRDGAVELRDLHVL